MRKKFKKCDFPAVGAKTKMNTGSSFYLTPNWEDLFQILLKETGTLTTSHCTTPAALKWHLIHKPL